MRFSIALFASYIFNANYKIVCFSTEVFTRHKLCVSTRSYDAIVSQLSLKLLNVNRLPSKLLSNKISHDPFDEKVTASDWNKEDDILNIGNKSNDTNIILKSRLLLVFVSALYGTNFSAVKLMEDSLEPSITSTLRFVLASIILLPLLKNIPIKTLRNGLEVGFWDVLAYSAQSVALVTTSACKSAFICSLGVVVVVILQQFFDKNGNPNDALDIKYTRLQGDIAENPRISQGTWTSALLACAGVACLEFGGFESPVVGDFWALAQPIFFGIGTWRTAKFAREVSNPGHLSVVKLITAAIFSLIWTTIAKDDWTGVLFTVQSNSQVLGALLWTSLITTALATIFETYALEAVDAIEYEVICSSEPLWASAFAIFLLGEKASLNTFGGAILILCACFWKKS